MSILMCKPSYYGIFYEINPWMHMDMPVIQETAKNQWQSLYETLLSLNIKIKLIEPINGLPDMVFTANAGFIYQNQAWISSFKSQERQPESEYFKSWFMQAGFEIVNMECELTQPPRFEGAGDALLFNNCLVAGYGFRSNLNVYEHPFFKQLNLLLCELINPYFYHLDTCFCPLDSSLALWYPDAFSYNSQRAMHKVGHLIDVPENEARRFACNAVVVGKHIILPSECPETYRLLEAHGFVVYICDMSEFIKAGGACKCLTLLL